MEYKLVSAGINAFRAIVCDDIDKQIMLFIFEVLGIVFWNVICERNEKWYHTHTHGRSGVIQQTVTESTGPPAERSNFDWYRHNLVDVLIYLAH